MSNLYASAHQLTEFGSCTYVPDTVVPPPTAIGETLVFPSGPTAAVDVDANYGVVLIDSAGTLTGGAADTIDASQASQHSAFFVSNAVGNGKTTLVGSPAAPATVTGAGDLFIVSSVAGAAAVAHTITIENFHTHDAVFLSGYGATDAAAFSTAIAASTPAGSLSVTLSDSTMIDFIGRHPTTTFNGGTVAT